MNKALSIFAAIFFTAGTSFAQTGDTWKKTVSRMIDLAQKEDTVVHHLTDVSNDTSLAEALIGAARAGKITAYSSFDCNFTTKLSIAQIKEMTAPRVDTMLLLDPVTNQEIYKIVSRDFNFDALRKFRILEEWTYNPHAGKTDIQITGISPMQDIYGDDGVYRGRKSLFWVKYNEVRPILTKYDQSHPTHTIASLIWDDYFLSDVKPGVQK